jgi:predicted TIM-barrel fold metal-dependent hydrolase
MDMPLNFHIGASDESGTWYGSAPWPSMEPDQKLAIGTIMLCFHNVKLLSNIIYSGMLERFPKLKLVSVESGIGWIPFVLESMDYQLTQMHASAFKHLTMKPSEYFRRQVYGCFWFERLDAPYMIERIGEDNVMFETDFPHPTSLYPDPLKYVGDAFESVVPRVRSKVLGGNAARVYNLPLE